MLYSRSLLHMWYHGQPPASAYWHRRDQRPISRDGSTLSAMGGESCAVFRCCFVVIGHALASLKRKTIHDTAAYLVTQSTPNLQSPLSDIQFTYFHSFKIDTKHTMLRALKQYLMYTVVRSTFVMLYPGTFRGFRGHAFELKITTDPPTLYLYFLHVPCGPHRRSERITRRLHRRMLATSCRRSGVGNQGGRVAALLCRFHRRSSLHFHCRPPSTETYRIYTIHG